MNRPRVVVHNTASVDGKITLSPDTLLLFGDERWTTVAGSSTEVYERIKAAHQPDVILEGSGSFVREGVEPEPLSPFEGDPATLYQDFLPDAVVHRPGHRGWFTVVDGRGRGRWLYQEYPDEEWAGWRLLVLVGQHTPPAYLAYLQRENTPYLVAGEGHVDLELALDKLNNQLDVACVLCTAGGGLKSALLRAGLVDEISLEFFPAVIGGKDTPSLFDGPALEPDQPPARLKLISAQVQADGRVWLHYQVLSS